MVGETFIRICRRAITLHQNKIGSSRWTWTSNLLINSQTHTTIELERNWNQAIVNLAMTATTQQNTFIGFSLESFITSCLPRNPEFFFGGVTVMKNHISHTAIVSTNLTTSALVINEFLFNTLTIADDIARIAFISSSSREGFSAGLAVLRKHRRIINFSRVMLSERRAFKAVFPMLEVSLPTIYYESDRKWIVTFQAVHGYT